MFFILLRFSETVRRNDEGYYSHPCLDSHLHRLHHRLPHDSPPDLKNCGRVCRAWVTASRFHLFYRVEIEYDIRSESTRGSSRLLQLLKGESDIALHIREFEFSGARKLHWDTPMNAILPLLPGKLTHLRKLTLRAIPFTRLEPHRRAAFRALFALPSLVDVAVNYFEVAKPEHFASLLCSHLTHLSVGMRFLDERRYPINPEVIGAVDEEVALQKRSDPCRLHSLSAGSPVFLQS